MTRVKRARTCFRCQRGRSSPHVFVEFSNRRAAAVTTPKSWRANSDWIYPDFFPGISWSKIGWRVEHARILRISWISSNFWMILNVFFTISNFVMNFRVVLLDFSDFSGGFLRAKSVGG